MDKQSYIQGAIDKLFATWLRNAAAFGASLFLLLSILDFVAFRAHFARFFAYRLAIALFLLLSAVLAGRTGNRTVLRAFGLAGVVASAVTIEVMILCTGGHVSPYATGMILLAVCVLAFVPAGLLFHATTSAVIYMIYLLPIVITERITDPKSFFITNFFMCSIILTVLALSHLFMRGVRKQLGTEYELIVSNNRLRESEATARALINSPVDSVFLIEPDGTILDVNETVAKRTGRSAGELTGRPIHELVPPGLAKSRGEQIDKVARLGVSVRFEDERDGRWYDHSYHPIADVHGKVVRIAIVARDITERKRAEEALGKVLTEKRIILDNLAIGVLFAVERKIVWMNDRLARMFGIAANEVAGAGTEQFYPDRESYLKIEREGYSRLAEGKTYATEMQMKKRDGALIWCGLVGQAVNPGRLEEGTIWLLEDVTDRRMVDERLQQSLKEKEVLLKEIHHRVKNNMQVIYSLLNLQARGIADKSIRAMFEESRNRVSSMALIHEKLYGSKDLAHIDFKGYLQSLVSGIADTYKRHDVVFDLDMEPVALDVNTGIPCGLIVNELVSNSLKYAFPEGRKGTITVGLGKNSEDGYVLTVADNGIGFPAEVDFRNTSSLGLKLVNVLTRQIHGTIELSGGLSRTEGTRFRMTFSGHSGNKGKKNG